ncbi:MAG: AarF/ABC1/UbiB kinase family protein [Deltaproteobacteria bacterium]|nr:MAG: AarF/ABC1/UbiB kinase family protein [Deltaproteobacteria bacterium]
MLRQAVGDLNRLRQIVQVLVKHGFGDILDRARILERLKIKHPRPEGQEKPAAERLARMLAELGPTFVKMGQLLSTRPDLIPPEYIAELRKLQDRAPPFDFGQVRKTVEGELGKPIEQLFAEFEPEPMASASIAQVHRAVTRSGERVVVKVKRPAIAQTIRSTIDVLYTLAHLLEAVVEETELFEPVEIVREFDRAIALELDFEQERRNLETFASNFADRTTMVCPKPIEGLCSASVITMTMLEGKRVDEIQPDSAEGKLVALNLIEGFYQQAFEDGFFHADPHPGNMLVLDDGRVALLDFGQMGRLTAAQRSTLVLLGLGIILKDADTVARLVYRIGSKKERVDLAEFRREVQEALEQALERRLEEIDSQVVLNRLVQLALRHRVRIPPEFTLAVKALVTVESTVRKIAPGLEPGAVAAPYIKRMLVEHYNLDDLRGGLGRILLQLTNLLTEVPRQLSQILLDLECGRMVVQVEDRQSPLLRRLLRGAAVDLFWGLVAAGLLAGAVPALLRPEPQPAAWWAIGAAMLVSAMVTARYFLSPFLRKLSIRQWLERDWPGGAPAPAKHSKSCSEESPVDNRYGSPNR